jgi:hypothetical protein
MMKQLVLYSTTHCHLCEKAEALLANYYHAFNWNIIDIADIVNNIIVVDFGIQS